MKTAKEFFDKMKNDQDFAVKICDELITKRDAGAKDYYETIIPTAAENGYEVTRADIDDILSVSGEEMSEEELGKVAGGTSCIAATAALIISSVISVAISLPVVTITVKETRS